MNIHELHAIVTKTPAVGDIVATAREARNSPTVTCARYQVERVVQSDNGPMLKLLGNGVPVRIADYVVMIWLCSNCLGSADKPAMAHYGFDKGYRTCSCCKADAYDYGGTYVCRFDTETTTADTDFCAATKSVWYNGTALRSSGDHLCPHCGDNEVHVSRAPRGLGDFKRMLTCHNCNKLLRLPGTGSYSISDDLYWYGGDNGKVVSTAEDFIEWKRLNAAIVSQDQRVIELPNGIVLTLLSTDGKTKHWFCDIAKLQLFGEETEHEILSKPLVRKALRMLPHQLP